MQVDRTGTFRCQATEWSVNKTKIQDNADGTQRGGLPQLVMRLYLTEYYDQQESEWVDFSEFQMEITAYLILYGKTKGTDKKSPTLNHQQAMKVFDWDGRSFIALMSGDYADLKFQVRIDENTYPGAKVPFQVGWLDVYDADPNRQLKKLNVEELKALDAEFAGLIRPAPKVATAVKAPSKVPTARMVDIKLAPPPEKPIKITYGGPPPLDEDEIELPNEPIAEETPPDTPEQKKAKMAARSARLRAETKKVAAKKPSVPAPPARTPVPGQVKSDCTKQLAWEAIVELRDPEQTDEQLKASWTNAINEIAGPGVTYEKITGDQWHDIKEKVLSEVGLF